VASIAGKLADRYGNRRFIAAGMLLQAVGLAWVATIAKAHLSFPELGMALTIAGVGTSLVFPTVSNEGVATVPPEEVGVASGTNSALRELGGVFGVAVLASVFTRPGVYASPNVFVDGFKAAIWVAAGFSAAGFFAALTAMRRPHLDESVARAYVEPALAEARD